MNNSDTQINHRKNMAGKAQVYISRHRIGSDGNGIRTLLSFTGCDLNCRYCINKELRSTTSDGRWYSPKDLLDEVLIDRYYFRVSAGGVTFSGGEPLLHAEFIREFAELASRYVDMDIETSLNVPEEAVETVYPYISKWFVDIKDHRPDVYESYTGCSMDLVCRNISFLRHSHCSVHFRVPVIRGYNTVSAIENAVRSDMINWADEIEKLEYITDMSNIPETDGKTICRTLMAVRLELVRQLKHFFMQPGSMSFRHSEQILKQLIHFCTRHTCHNTGNCLGTCPRCDQEMARIMHAIDALDKESRIIVVSKAAIVVQNKFKNDFTTNGIKKNKVPEQLQNKVPFQLMGF